jgi:hypothetical protein
MTTSAPRLPPMIRLLAIAGGLGAANIHYSQRLLPVIASSIMVPVDRIGFLPAVTQPRRRRSAR